MKGTKIIYLRRKVIAAIACAAAAVMMFWVVNHPAVVGAAATTRQLPIYCVQKDYKVLSISFDAAWGDVILRHGQFIGALCLIFFVIFQVCPFTVSPQCYKYIDK